MRPPVPTRTDAPSTGLQGLWVDLQLIVRRMTCHGNVASRKDLSTEETSMRCQRFPKMRREPHIFHRFGLGLKLTFFLYLVYMCLLVQVHEILLLHSWRCLWTQCCQSTRRKRSSDAYRKLMGTAKYSALHFSAPISNFMLFSFLTKQEQAPLCVVM